MRFQAKTSIFHEVGVFAVGYFSYRLIAACSRRRTYQVYSLNNLKLEIKFFFILPKTQEIFYDLKAKALLEPKVFE